MQKKINTDKAPGALGPYSQAVEIDQLVYTSGQLGIDPATGELAEGVEAQAKLALENAKETLKAASAADKSALVSKIDEADAALQAAIDKVVKDLADTKAELVAKDESLTTMAVIAIVIASIGVCGCGGFVTWFFLDRKKKIGLIP